MKISTLLFILFFFTFKTFSQNSFEVNISFPENLDNNKVQIKYDAGKGFQQVSKSFEQGKLNISDKLYVAYALIEITFLGKETQKKTFLVNEEPAEISFSNTDLSKFQLKNAQDLWENGEQAFLEFFTPIEQEFKAFFQANAEKLNAGDDSLQNILSRKIHHLNVKRLEFIQKHSEWFYSFLIFKNHLLSSKIDVKTLNKTFENTFSEKIKTSWQGQKVAKFLEGKSLKVGDKAPNFSAKDMQGNQVTLSNFENKKYVLLVFWASWCKYCIAEMPDMQEIYQTYANSDLEMIAISQDWDEKACKNAIEKYNMTWTHLFKQNQVSELFAITETPSFLLLDKKGKILLKALGLQKDDIATLKNILNETL